MNAANRLHDYFETEVDRIQELLQKHADDRQGATFRRCAKITAVSMLDSLAGIYQPEATNNSRRFRRFVETFCEWNEGQLVSVPILRERIKGTSTALEANLEQRLAELPQDIGGSILLTAIDSDCSEFLAYASTDSEKREVQRSSHL